MRIGILLYLFVAVEGAAKGASRACALREMSLTNYLTQSMVGSFIYFGYGLSLYDDLGTTASFAVGILLFILQLGFCHWWLAHHKQGPFEGVWRKATWMFS